MTEYSETNQRPKLKKAIGRLGFFSLAFGSMIGVGWITGLQGMFEQAGPVGTTIAFAAGGLLMIVIGLCYAEAMKMLPVTGGEVAYAYKAFGTSKAFIVGWCLAIGYISVSAFEAVSIGIVVSFIFDFDWWPLYEFGGSTVYGSHVLLALLLTTFFALINHWGVGIATRVQTGLTMVLIVCALAFISAGFWSGNPDHLAPAFGQPGLGVALGGMLAVFVTVPFWFVGFDTIPQAAEERTEGFPPHRLGQMLVLAIAGSTLFYVLVFLSVGMTTPWQTIIDEPLPTAAAFQVAFGSPFWARLVLVVGLLGLLTSWNGFFLSGCRVLFALGRGHIIHPVFGRPHPKFGTPTAAILFSALVTFLGSLLGKQAILVFVNVGSLCISVSFLGVALSIIQIRRSSDEQLGLVNRILPYVAGLGAIFILGAMIIPGSPAMLPWPIEWAVLAVFVLGGTFFWFSASKIRDKLPESERSRLILDGSD